MGEKGGAVWFGNHYSEKRDWKMNHRGVDGQKRRDGSFIAQFHGRIAIFPSLRRGGISRRGGRVERLRFKEEKKEGVQKPPPWEVFRGGGRPSGIYCTVGKEGNLGGQGLLRKGRRGEIGQVKVISFLRGGGGDRKRLF